MYENTRELLAKLSRVSELLHRYSHRNHRMHGPACDPLRGQGRVMALLKMRPEISQKELSYLLDIRPQSLGELLAKLERNGYIERSASEEDRRVMNIRLTEDGAAKAGEAREGSGMFKSLDADEQDKLCEYLDRIIAELEEELSVDRCGPDCDCGDEHPHPRGRRFHGHGRHGEWHPGMERRPHGTLPPAGGEKGCGHGHGRHGRHGEPEFERGRRHGGCGCGGKRGERPRRNDGPDDYDA